MATGGTPETQGRRQASPLTRVTSASAIVFPSPADTTSPASSLTGGYASTAVSPAQAASLTGSVTSPSMASPVLAHGKSSGGRLGAGVMKLLRIPTSNHTTAAHLNVVDTEPVVSNNKAKFSRMLKHRVRFRRGKHRSDKQYHSDDGYTSDPGQVRGEEEDETDGEPPLSAEVRRIQQVKELEKKLEKARTQLQEEEENSHEYKNEYVQEMESTMNDKAQLKIKARFQTRQDNYREKSEKLKKKIEKLDEQLRQAKENPVDNHTWKQKGMASIREIRGKL